MYLNTIVHSLTAEMEWNGSTLERVQGARPDFAGLLASRTIITTVLLKLNLLILAISTAAL